MLFATIWKKSMLAPSDRRQPCAQLKLSLPDEAT